MTYLEIQIIIAASIYLLIGIGTSIGFYLASTDIDSFKKAPIAIKILGVFLTGFLWIITITAKSTYLLFDR